MGLTSAVASLATQASALLIRTIVAVLTRLTITAFFFGDNSAKAILALTAQLLLIGPTFFITDRRQSIMVGA